jgi:hypothetical protein
MSISGECGALINFPFPLKGEVAAHKEPNDHVWLQRMSLHGVKPLSDEDNNNG